MLFSYNLEQTETIEPGAFLNPGMNYGDGIFETLLIEDEEIMFLESHLQRLRKGLESMQLILDFTDEEIKSHLAILTQNFNDRGYLKIYVWRRQSLAYRKILNNADIAISLVSSPTLPKEVISSKVYQSDHFYPSEISAFKTLSSIKYVLAGLFCEKNKIDTCLILNQDNRITETLTANIFWIKEDQIFTPNLQSGCIDGIIRNQVLELVDVTEGPYTLEDISSATCVFSTNSGGIQYLKKIDDVSFSTFHPIIEELKAELF